MRLNKLAAQTLPLAFFGGCYFLPFEEPRVYSENEVRQVLAGEWQSEEGIVFRFDETGRLDYYGKEQFGEYAFDNEQERIFGRSVYGPLSLTDFVETSFSSTGFESLLTREFLQYDYIEASQAILTGRIINEKKAELDFQFAGDDFYGARIRDEPFIVTKIDAN